MKTASSKGIRGVCLICFEHCPRCTLRRLHHCCTGKCEEKYFEIVLWERDNFGKSHLEKLSKNY